MQESLTLMPALLTSHGQESSFCLSGSPPLSSLPLVGHDFPSNDCSFYHVELSFYCSRFSEIAWDTYLSPFCSSTGLSFSDFQIYYLLKVKTSLLLPF